MAEVYIDNHSTEALIEGQGLINSSSKTLDYLVFNVHCIHVHVYTFTGHHNDQLYSFNFHAKWFSSPHSKSWNFQIPHHAVCIEQGAYLLYKHCPQWSISDDIGTKKHAVTWQLWHLSVPVPVRQRYGVSPAETPHMTVHPSV